VSAGWTNKKQCPKCGAPNPPRYAKCWSCGAWFGKAPESEAEEKAPAGKAPVVWAVLSVCVILAATLAVVAWSVNQSQQPDTSAPPVPFVPAAGPASAASGKTTVELRLARLQKGNARDDDPLITDMKRELDIMQRKCTDDRERLGDYTISSQKILREKGLNQNLLSVLVGVNQSLAGVNRPIPCADMFNGYALQKARGG